MLDTNKITLIKETVKKEVGISLEEIHFLGRGACNNLYYCKSQDGQEMVIKEERHDKLDSELNDLITEANILKFLNISEVNNIPVVRLISQKYRLYGYTYLRGQTLDTIISKFSKLEIEQLIDDLCKFHAQLHSLNLEKISIDLYTVDINQFLLQATVEVSKLLEACAKSDKLYPLLTSIMSQINAISGQKSKIALVQGDAHPGNIIVNKNKLVGIIDFGKCEITDIHYDFSHYIRALPEFIDQFIESYWKYSNYRLIKDRLILFAIILDISKTTYHIDRLNAGKLRIENNLEKLNKFI